MLRNSGKQTKLTVIQRQSERDSALGDQARCLFPPFRCLAFPRVHETIITLPARGRKLSATRGTFQDTVRRYPNASISVARVRRFLPHPQGLGNPRLNFLKQLEERTQNGGRAQPTTSQTRPPTPSSQESARFTNPHKTNPSRGRTGTTPKPPTRGGEKPQAMRLTDQA